MLGEFDIEKWLFEHSRTTRHEEKEITFEHPTGSHSVLLLRESSNICWLDSFPSLSVFYTKYAGGFIGDKYLMIGTPIGESLTTSEGVIVPSVQEIRSVAETQGMVFDDDEIPFMTTAYMFVYSISKKGCSDVMTEITTR